MPKIHRSIEIDAPVERVYEFLSEPSNLPEIWPSMIEVSNVTRDEQGRPEFDWHYKMVGVHFRGHTRTTEQQKNARIVTESEIGIKTSFVYVFEDLDGKTRFTEDVEYTVPGKLLGKLAEPIVSRVNEREADSFVENLKARMELAEAREVAEEAREAAEEAREEERPGPEAQPPAH